MHVTEDLASGRDLHPLSLQNHSAEPARDEEPPDLHFAFDLAVLADEQVTVRKDLAIDASIDSKGVLELELAGQRATFVQKSVELSSRLIVLEFQSTPPV
jgi:hypothetical protein